MSKNAGDAQFKQIGQVLSLLETEWSLAQNSLGLDGSSMHGWLVQFKFCLETSRGVSNQDHSSISDYFSTRYRHFLTFQTIIDLTLPVPIQPKSLDGQGQAVFLFNPLFALIPIAFPCIV